MERVVFFFVQIVLALTLQATISKREYQICNFKYVNPLCDDSPEMDQILISLCFGIHSSCYHYQKFKTFKKSKKKKA